MASITLHITLKNSLSFIVGLCVVVLALIPLTVPANHLSWLGWQITVWVAVGIALLALFVQVCLQSRDDAEMRDLLRKILEGKGATAISSERARPSISPQAVTQKQDDLDGELQRVFVYPRLGIPYKLIQEAWTKVGGHAENPKVDCDIILAMYAVNRSQSVTYFVRDLVASVEVDGTRKELERLDNFRL